MQTSICPPQPAPQKVKNILIRHSCSRRVQENSRYQHPETSYILKYAPKYYKSLTLHTTCQSPLLSKVKKIKKLKAFTGYFDRYLPQQLWFDLLGNTRKEIEEIPQISSKNGDIRPGESFWKRLNQQKLDNFWNLTRIWLPKWRLAYLIDNLDNFLSSKEQFVKYLWNMRRLKSLKIMVRDHNYEKVQWVLAKLDRMSVLYGRLETLSLDVRTDNKNIQQFFQNKTFFSHLTSLDLAVEFDPIFAKIPFLSKNLNSLSLNFEDGVRERSEFRTLLASIQELTQLKSLQFAWPPEEKNVWSYFKPQPSVEYLCLRLGAYQLINAGFLQEGKAEDFVDHWEDLKEVKTLGFSLSCSNYEDLNLVKLLITKVLKKAKKLETLRLWIWTSLEEEDSQKTYMPFLVEDVSHLYGTLERFEYQLSGGVEGRSTRFDLKTLMPFKNLKSLKLEGSMEFKENIEEIVSLLEGNQKEKEYPLLELNFRKSIESPTDWLRNTLEVLERTKRAEKNLKIIIDLTIGLKGYLEALEGMCCAIQLVKITKGLEICLDFHDYNDEYSQLAIEQVKQLLSRYPGIRNLKVRLANCNDSLGFIKMDGEKEQFFVNIYE